MMSRNNHDQKHSSQSSGGMKEKLVNILYKLLPIEELRDLPRIYAFSLIGLAYMFLFGIFIYFLQDIYILKQNEKFLSLDENAGTCKEVTSVIDGTFLADTHGNWEGSVGFEYALAIYSATFRRFRGSKEEYDNILNQAFAKVAIAANKSYSQNLAANMLIWMTSSNDYESNNALQTIKYTGSSKTVFNRKIIVAGLANENGNCEVIPTVSYDKNSGIALITWDYVQYIASSTCMSIVNPVHMGFIPYSNSFVLQLDTEAMMMAVGINLKIVPADQLEVIHDTEFSFITKGVFYRGALTYHPRNPGMEPLICLQIEDTSSSGLDNDEPDNYYLVCGVQFGDLILYPIFNHFGTKRYDPAACDCSDESGLSAICNTFLFDLSFIFYDYSEQTNANDDTDDYDTYTSDDDMMALVNYYNNSAVQLTAMGYNASVDAIQRNKSDPQWRKNAYEFCSGAEKGVTRGCSVLSLFVGDNVVSSISEYYYQVSYGSCNDSFSISQEAQQKLLDTPPTPLSEIYFECKLNPANALTTALGLAMGNVILLRFACIILIGLVVHVYVTRKKHTPSAHLHTYSTQEKQKVLEYLAFLLLMARDGRYGRTSESVAISSILDDNGWTGGMENVEEVDDNNVSDSISDAGGDKSAPASYSHAVGSRGMGFGGGTFSLVQELQRELTDSGTVRRFFGHESDGGNEYGGGGSLRSPLQSEGASVCESVAVTPMDVPYQTSLENERGVWCVAKDGDSIAGCHDVEAGSSSRITNDDGSDTLRSPKAGVEMRTANSAASSMSPHDGSGQTATTTSSRSKEGCDKNDVSDSHSEVSITPAQTSVSQRSVSSSEFAVFGSGMGRWRHRSVDKIYQSETVPNPLAVKPRQPKNNVKREC